MTAQELDVLSLAIAKLVKQAIAEKVAPLLARIAELEQRPATLKYAGVFDPSDTYDIDEAVSYGGSLWIARETTTGARPGDSLAWQLCVKHARTRTR